MNLDQHLDQSLNRKAIGIDEISPEIWQATEEKSVKIVIKLC